MHTISFDDNTVWMWVHYAVAIAGAVIVALWAYLILKGVFTIMYMIGKLSTDIHNIRVIVARIDSRKSANATSASAQERNYEPYARRPATEKEVHVEFTAPVSSPGTPVGATPSAKLATAPYVPIVDTLAEEDFVQPPSLSADPVQGAGFSITTFDMPEMALRRD